jgi:hypothetical protein
MKNEFIPYEQALDLKELGFDEECLTSYHNDGTLMDIWSVMGFVTNSSLRDPQEFSANSNSKLLKDYIDNPFTAAPLYQQAFRWFREKYDLMVVIQTMVKDSWLLRIESIDSTTINGVYNSKRWHLDDDEDYVDPKSYEEAELACLNKLIEICKEKKS